MNSSDASSRGTVVADISMSLDGFITGPGPDLEHGLGRGGEAIQQWVFASHDSPRDRAILESADQSTGAVVMGRRTFDFIDGPHGWDEEVSYSYDHPTPSLPPIFVVTHQVPARPRHSGFTYVTTGIEAALTRAREAAGEREVVIMGGASVIAQALTARLVDRIRIHLSPVLMGAGTPLFELVDETIQLLQEDVVITPNVSHLTYTVDTERRTRR
ncbi:MAG TPA: dihydrofolate reductase family protein [Candidatus Brachybacterium merdavium]|uniref:Dihydrofolate reductase family protein n=1 Tax=Candidatus Brachybacterium merdavium TaxID=2838513 RepID=A0A9D2LD57_9MICO|nr:dihydrofolate reductase family protein [Candidatus Brachybacterium merdavium]